MRTGVLAAGAAALVLVALLPERAEAQRQPTPRRQTIEIRGQVPTPQVVTVRPRETPVVSRRVLVPEFFDRSFWPVILPGYQLVSREALAGTDTIPAPPAPGVAPGGAQPAPVLTPTVIPRAGQPVVAPAPATSDEELEAIRRELREREIRLDSLSREVQRQFQPQRDTTTTVPRDTTTTRPPGGR